MVDGTDTTATVDQTTIAASSTVTPDAIKQPDPGSFVNPDGTLKDGWRDLIPEDFRGRQVFDTVGNLGDVFKQLGNKDVLISRQGKGVMVPPKNATPTERDMFFDAIGRPKTAADYKVELPKGMEEYYDVPFLEEAKMDLHKAGLTQEQVDIVMAVDQKRLVKGLEQLKAQEEAASKEAETALRTRWGPAYDERLHIANRMIAENVANEEEKAELLSLIGNKVRIADFLATIGKKFMEGKLITGGVQSTQMTPQEHETRGRELMETPGFIQGTLPQATRDRLQKEIDAHYAAARPKVGATGTS